MIKAWLTTYALYIASGVIVLLLISGAVLIVQLKLAKSATEVAIAEKNTALSQLASQQAVVKQQVALGERLAAGIDRSQVDAAKEREANRQERERHAKEKPPVGCEEANAWATEKAAELLEGW